MKLLRRQAARIDVAQKELVLAVQRKLLEMTYVLFKNNCTYGKSYLLNSPLSQETL